MTYRILSVSLLLTMAVLLTTIFVSLQKRQLKTADLLLKPLEVDAVLPAESDLNRTEFAMRMVETGDGFHGDQVEAKDGQRWLGLFLEDGKYFLETRPVRVRLVNDPVIDGDVGMTGKSVETVPTGTAIFLLRNAPMLKEGGIETVFYNGKYEGLPLENWFSRTFRFGGKNYELRVENSVAVEKYLGKGSRLVLSDGENSQVLTSLPNGCTDCYWTLYWAGDLDRDGKLDLYLDLSNHFNVMDKRLFLSGQAKPGRLVKLVAEFWTNGC